MNTECRKWIEQRYQFTKQLNPRLPINIREGHDIPPVIIARYGIEKSFATRSLFIRADFGSEFTYDIQDKSMEQIDGILETIYKQGAEMPRSPESRPDDLDVVDDFHYALYKKGPVRVSDDKY